MIFTVTGANGFLGVHIIHHLLQGGHTVRAIIRPGASLQEFDRVKPYYDLPMDVYTNLQWHHCQLHNVLSLSEVMQGSDYAMHLAGYISYLQKDYKKLITINQTYTQNVVNACLGTSIKKLLYCSSIAAISKSTIGNKINENNDWDSNEGHSNYGYSKYLGECELWRAQEEGLSVVAINPGIILGYGDWNKGSNKLFKNAATGFPFFSHGITGWVGVGDVANVALKLCMSDLSGERYLVVSENRTFSSIAYKMTEAFQTRTPFIEIKGWLYSWVYRLIALKEFLGFGGMLSKETVRASVSINNFDNTKVKNALNMEFEPMDNVVSNSIVWYKKTLAK